jgi:acyl-CoA thioesterase-1
VVDPHASAHPQSFLVANPLISRGRAVLAADGSARKPDTGRRFSPALQVVATESAAGWLAIQVQPGPKSVLLGWAAPSGPYMDLSRDAPASYRIESSADSSDGADGSWRLEQEIDGNPVRRRAHRLEFDGRSWVRLVLPGGSEARFESLEVHDASDGTDDSWLCLGTGAALSPFAPTSPEDPGSFAELVYARYPTYTPAVLDAGLASETSAAGLARLDSLLQLNPDFHGVVLGYGLEDSHQGVSAQQFRSNLLALVERLLALDKLPVLAKLVPSPASGNASIEAYNRVITDLTSVHRLLPGPDLESWLREHPAHLDEEGEPNTAGRAAIGQLWLEALDPLYAPQ